MSCFAIAFAEDRFFPLDGQNRVARERLGLEVEPTPGGHCAYLSHPAELAARLAARSGSPGRG